MLDIHRSCDTRAESLQPKEGLSRKLNSCVARCEAYASVNDYEVNAGCRASLGIITILVLF
jgi:hypothetical protein